LLPKTYNPINLTLLENRVSRFAKLIPIAVVSGALFISACANTVRGVGRDVNNTVDAVEDSVN